MAQSTLAFPNFLRCTLSREVCCMKAALIFWTSNGQLHWRALLQMLHTVGRIRELQWGSKGEQTGFNIGSNVFKLWCGRRERTFWWLCHSLNTWLNWQNMTKAYCRKRFLSYKSIVPKSSFLKSPNQNYTRSLKSEYSDNSPAFPIPFYCLVRQYYDCGM